MIIEYFEINGNKYIVDFDYWYKEIYPKCKTKEKILGDIYTATGLKFSSVTELLRSKLNEYSNVFVVRNSKTEFLVLKCALKDEFNNQKIFQHLAEIPITPDNVIILH